MSPLTNHTTSLELSIALKEAGWPQDLAFFRWIRPEGPELSPVQKFAKEGDFILTDTNYSFPEEWGNYAAPLASELMERMLNKPILIDGVGSVLAVEKYRNFFFVGFRNFSAAGEVKSGESLPDALATLALFLVKEGKMKF